MPPRRTWIWFIALLLGNFVLLRVLKPGAEPSITVPYTLFKDEVQKENVESIYSRGDMLTGRFRTDVTYPAAARGAGCGVALAGAAQDCEGLSRPPCPPFVDQGLEKFLIDHHVRDQRPADRGGAEPRSPRSSTDSGPHCY